MIDSGFFEILDLENVKIDTKVKSASCIQPELIKVIQCMCVTLSSKVNRQGWFSKFLISSTSKMLESTPRSTLYHVCSRRYERSCKKVFDLDFQGHAMNIEFFHYHRWIPWPRKHTHEKYARKFRTGRPKSRGVVPTPPGRPKVDFYLGHLRVNTFWYIS